MTHKKACMIVGAGPGLGASIARRFAREQYMVALISRSSSMARPDTATSKWFPGNAASPESLRAAIEAAVQWTGGADVLVYNAAALDQRPVTELDAETLLSDLAVNVAGAVTAVGCVLPHLRASGRGTIVFTGGGLAHLPHPLWSTLGAGKAALLNYSHALRRALEGSGIRVATVSICGIIERGGLFDPDTIADVYWTAHSGAEPPAEILYQPTGADPAYNDRAAS